MPIHDWSRVYSGAFDHFHRQWTGELCDALNDGRLPRGYFALVDPSDSQAFSNRANRIGVRNPFGELAAVIEIVSPGNKETRTALRSFIAKAVELLEHHVHLLIVDLFPPGKRDPQGIHKAIWDEIQEEPFELTDSKPLTVAAYFAGIPYTAYVEPVAVGELLPGLPLFLDDESYILAPLEVSYEATWRKCPGPYREQIEKPQ